jgi:K319-like protein
MNSIQKVIAHLLVLAGICFIGCKKEYPAVNVPPVAYAGEDQNITLPVDSTRLFGNATDADGSIVTYKWRRISGPSSVTILDSNAAVTKVKNLVTGGYEFELEVTDNGGLSAADKVVVTVNPAGVTGGNYTNYVSKQSGNWNSASSWKLYDGFAWTDATTPPDGAYVQVNILPGHIITVDSAVQVAGVTIDSLGTLTIASNFTFGGDLVNNGTLNWQNGNINLFGGYVVVTLTNNGSLLITGNNGTSSNWWDSEVRIVNNGVIKKISAGLTDLTAAHSLTNSSTGIIEGFGILSASGNISWLPDVFTNNGTIAPGLPIGILTIRDVLKPFSPNSVLQLDVLDNAGPGVGHDQLVFNNDITLAGKLVVTEVGSAVANGRFTIITTTGTIKGNFSSINLPPGYSLQINGSNVEVVKQ